MDTERQGPARAKPARLLPAEQEQLIDLALALPEGWFVQWDPRSGQISIQPVGADARHVYGAYAAVPDGRAGYTFGRRLWSAHG